MNFASVGDMGWRVAPTDRLWRPDWARTLEDQGDRRHAQSPFSMHAISPHAIGRVNKHSQKLFVAATGSFLPEIALTVILHLIGH